MCPNGILPSIQIYGDDEDSGEMFDNFETTSEAFMWARQTSIDFEPHVRDVNDNSNYFSFTLSSLSQRHQEVEGTLKLKKFKKKYFAGLMKMSEVFGLKNFGVMNKSPVVMKNEGCQHILQIIYAKKESVPAVEMKGNKCVWKGPGKLDSSIFNKDSLSIWSGFDRIYKRSMQYLNSGLYCVLFNCVLTTQGPSKSS